ncbi:hypothetical protein DSO57_1031168 [Entomophthora muscae]|uniref:Uncharacterized protein n=1 Tax=Entomophthora muscae TaxID=34485 RepID=A0ACC2S2L5_9FUNG|nr:hypothetical protein DSO57_1031168 [Entomophthora muscae]
MDASLAQKLHPMNLQRTSSEREERSNQLFSAANNSNGNSCENSSQEEQLFANSPQPNSPCSIHSLIDPNLRKSIFRKTSYKESQDTSTLARSAVAVRAVSKKLYRKRIKWYQPKTVMIVTKPGDKLLGVKARDYVDKHLEKNRRFDIDSLLASLPAHVKPRLKFWQPELVQQSPELFDFVITLGGDGTVLYTSWLFQKVVPAVIPFHLGSLGFLTPFDFAYHKQLIQNSLDEGVRINIRIRFSCTIYRHQANPLGATNNHPSPKKIISRKSHGTTLFSEAINEEEEEETDCETPPGKFPGLYKGFHIGDTYEILNDLVVDRGPSASMSQLELYGDGSYLTTVQADGLAVATPTGSTAYSLAAGGSLVHPEIPALLITPICPHSLSFRPMLLPDSTILFICVPYRARGSAWASFDGRGRVELMRGDFIRVEASKYPFPTVCASGTQSKDWFNSLNRCLLWNQRTLQKSISLSSDPDSSSDDE